MVHLCCINLSRRGKNFGHRAKISEGGRNSGPKDGISAPPGISIARGENSALVRKLQDRYKNF
jgi:hypothetical protein